MLIPLQCVQDTKAGKGEGGYRSRSGYILRPHNDVGGTTPMKESRPNLPGTMSELGNVRAIVMLSFA